MPANSMLKTLVFISCSRKRISASEHRTLGQAVFPWPEQESVCWNSMKTADDWLLLPQIRDRWREKRVRSLTVWSLQSKGDSGLCLSLLYGKGQAGMPGLLRH